MLNFSTVRQLLKAAAYGLPTNSETMTLDVGAGVITKVYDMLPKAFGEQPDKRMPVYVKVQNLGTTVVRVLEDVWGDPAGVPNHFPPPVIGSFDNFIAMAGGTASNDGLGTSFEWQRNRPRAIYLYSPDAYRVTILKRYGEES